MSLFIATEEEPEPSLAFPNTLTEEPLSVNNPVAEISTVVFVPFATVIAPFRPMVVVPVELEPAPILIGPVRPLPLPMLSVSADDVLFAILMVDVESLVPLAMFNIELFVEFPFKKCVVALLKIPLKAFVVEDVTFPEKTFVNAIVVSPAPILKVPVFLVPPPMFNTELLVEFPENTFVVAPLVSPVPKLNVPPFLVPVTIFTVGMAYDVLNVRFPLPDMFTEPPPIFVFALEPPLLFIFTVPAPLRAPVPILRIPVV